MNNTPIPYTVVYSNRKTLSIIIERDRSVVVRAPHHITEDKIAQAVKKRHKLIQQKIDHNAKYPYEKPSKEFVTGESLMYLGHHYKLYVVDEPVEGVVFDNKFFISKANQQRANEIFKNWYIGQAKELLIPKAIHIAKRLGVTYNHLNIMDLKFRWGSCTPKDNIHLNWRLIKAPMTVIEYIIVHELTHLLEANHTPEFWNRVASQLPTYEKAKRWLKENGHALEVDF